MKFKTAKSARTFERVLSAAGRLFAQKGFERTTMRDLAKEGELGLGALYYYFKSKEELVLVFYERINDQAREKFLPKLEEFPNLSEAVRAFLNLKLELLKPHRDLLRVIIKEAVDPKSPLCPLNPESAQPLNTSVGIFESMVERYERLKSEEKQQRARVLWMAHMAVLGYWVHDRSDQFEATEEVIETAVSFLKMSQLLMKVPGMGGFRSRLGEHVDRLFPQGEERPGS